MSGQRALRRSVLGLLAVTALLLAPAAPAVATHVASVLAQPVQV